MGTNYYVEKNKCDCCGRSDREYHIGKSSIGWCFCFQAYPWIKLSTWKDWKEFLLDQNIIDEYGHRVGYDEFVAMVEGFKSPKNNKYQHNVESKKSGNYNTEYDWDDDDGYPFTTREFS